jgi:outer membrane protein TolC
MVLMRDSRRHCLMTFGLAASLTCLPLSMAVASDLSVSPEAGTDSLQDQDLAQTESTPLDSDLMGPEDLDPALPLDAELDGLSPAMESSLEPIPQPGATPAMESSLEAVPQPGLTLEPGEEPLPLEAEVPLDDSTSLDTSDAIIPQSERPTEEGFEDLPDYLTPDPNPLLTPTQPEEVEIVGTQPLSLETAVELAYRNNEQLQIALLQLERAQSGLRAELAQRLPTVDLTAGLQTGDQVSIGDIQANTDDITTILQGGVRTDYDLGISGERGARIRAAEDQVRLAELQAEQVRAQLRLDTTNDYYAVQAAIESIRINQAFLDEAERNLRDTELREEVGVGTRFDVLRADVQVANARQALTQAISQRQISQRQLARRLNVPPSIDLTTLSVEIAGTWPLSLEESIVLAYQNRAELEQFLVEREFNAEQRQVALAQIRPNLGLFAEYNLQDVLSDLGPGQGAFDDGFSLGAQFTWRLFDGGAARARAEQASRDADIDESEFEDARNQIRLEVEEAYFTLLANQENIDTASLAVAQAREALELANLRFNAGVGTQLDVLSATSELTQAQGNLVTAVLDYNRALARIERAVSNLAEAGDGATGLDL